MNTAKIHNPFSLVQEQRKFFGMVIKILYLMVTLIIMSYGGFYWYIGLYEMVYIAGGLLVAYSFVYFTLTRPHHLRLKFFLFILLTYLSFVLEIVFTGGLRSSVVPHLLLVPLISLFYSKKKTLWLYFAVVLLTILFFILIPDTGVLPPSGVPPEYETAFDQANYAFVFLIVFFLAFLLRNEGRRFSKNMEDAFRELEETYQQLLHSDKLATIGQQTAAMAHEVSNVVNVMQMGVIGLRNSFEELKKHEVHRKQVIEGIRMLLKNGSGTAEIKAKITNYEESQNEADYEDIMKDLTDIVDSMKDGVTRTHQIVKGLSTFSRIDPMTYQPASIHELIDSTLILLKSQCKDRIKIVRKFRELPLVQCNAGKINQVLMNLLSNAIQAIDGNGVISISTAVHADGDKVCIEITDTGTGISRNIAGKIFDPFFTTRETGTGTGLGLFVSKGIVDDHRGELTFENNPDGGTVFRLVLPVSV